MAKVKSLYHDELEARRAANDGETVSIDLTPALTGPRLPSWCATAQGRSLITAIMAEQPTRRTDDAMGFKTTRYNGRNATQLRNLFDQTYQAMIAWVDEARVPTAPGRPMKPADAARYEQRRDAVIAWAEKFGPDALIARVLGEAL
jgi:hypothetical protein